MLFSDPSCRAELTLKESMALGVYHLCQLDWAAICTKTEHGNIYIDGQVSVTDADVQEMTRFITEKGAEIVYSDQPVSFRIDDCYYWYYPIRKGAGYWVFSIFCKKGGLISESNLNWLKVYSELKYDYILLNNETVQERELSNNVMDSIESAIIVLDLQMKVVSCNSNVKAVLGLSSCELLGRDSLDALKCRYRDAFVRKFTSAISGGGKQYINELMISLNEDEQVLNITISPLHNSKKDTVGAVIVVTDVTKRYYMEHELQQSRQFRLLDQIAAGLAHDVKNPLMTINGCVRALRKGVESGDEREEFFNVILHESARINVVIEQMLSFGNVTNRNQQETIDINDVLANSVKIISRQKNWKFIDIDLDLEDGIPWIRADNRSMQQAFLNILVNSLEAIEDSGEIRVSSRLRDDGHIEVRVRDTGRGISGENMKKLFTPYYSTKDVGTNNGLGLYLAKRVFTQFGAQIEVSSDMDVGTEVLVNFPCVCEEQ